MNITAFGNDDRLDVGIALDPAAIEEPDVLVECLTETFATYAAAASDASGDAEAGAEVTRAGGRRPRTAAQADSG